MVAVPAPAPAPRPPACPGGSSGLWHCGSLAFDEATYTVLLGEYPLHCTALSAEALLCGGVLLSPEAQVWTWLATTPDTSISDPGRCRCFIILISCNLSGMLFL